MAKRQTFGTIIPSTSGRYRARYVHPEQPHKDDGKQNYINAPTTFRTKTEARQWLNEIQADIARGRWKSPDQERAEKAAAQLQAQRDAYTFGAFATNWLQNRVLRESTRRSYQSNLDSHLLPYWQDVPVKTIATTDVKTWLTVLAPGNEGAREHAYELFRSIMNTAVEDDLIPYSPCKRDLLSRVKPAKGNRRQKQREPRALTMDQLEALAGEVPAHMRLMVLWSGLVGFRSGEIRALQGADIKRDDDGQLWASVKRTATGQGKHLTIGPPKTAKSTRLVPVPPSIATAVEALANTSGKKEYLFHPVNEPRRVIPESTYWENTKNAGKRAGIGPVTPHDLRHTAASIARDNGGSETAVRDLLGHTTTTMTDHYTHTSQESLISLVCQVDQVRYPPTEVTSMDARRKPA